MKAQITSFKKHKSKYGDVFFYVFFKDENGQSLKSCIYPNMRNFQKWDKVVRPGMVLDNLKLKHKGLIDADSQFHVVGIKEIKKPVVVLKTPAEVEIDVPTAVQTNLF
tara:strand:- start:20 stop:343 length:324 start_codon:yes stop_codon:yes gene_type:complete